MSERVEKCEINVNYDSQNLYSYDKIETNVLVECFNGTVTNCHSFKMTAFNGKKRKCAGF